MARCPGKLIQDAGVEDLGHQPQAPVHADPFAVAGDDAAGLLAPVLEGVEAEVGDAGGLGVPVNAEDAAVFPGFVVFRFRFRFRFSVFFMAPHHVEMEMQVIISGFCVRFQVKRSKIG